jgi:hypothetical protein
MFGTGSQRASIKTDNLMDINMINSQHFSQFETKPSGQSRGRKFSCKDKTILVEMQKLVTTMEGFL